MSAAACTDCSSTSFGLGGRGAHLVIPSLIAPISAFILVANRIYWRLRLLDTLGFDDVSALLAMVSRIFTPFELALIELPKIFLVVQCASSIAAVDHGYGRPFHTLTEHQASQALKVGYFFLSK